MNLEAPPARFQAAPCQGFAKHTAREVRHICSTWVSIYVSHGEHICLTSDAGCLMGGSLQTGGSELGWFAKKDVFFSTFFEKW